MRHFVFVSISSLYGLWLIFCGFVGLGGGGAGHGVNTAVPMMLAASPYGAGIFFYPVVGFLLADSASRSRRNITIGLLAVHYLGMAHVAFMYSARESTDFPVVYERMPFFMWQVAAVYLAGHAFVWLHLFRGRSEMP